MKTEQMNILSLKENDILIIKVPTNLVPMTVNSIIKKVETALELKGLSKVTVMAMREPIDFQILRKDTENKNTKKRP